MIDPKLAEQMQVPEGKTRVLIQFNKITGAIAAVMSWVDPKTLNQDFWEYREAYMDQSTQSVQGTLADYSIVNNDDLPQVILESEMNAAARDKITKRYPLSDQVNVLGRAIKALSEQAGVETDELDEMLDYIQEVQRANKRRKDHYQKSEHYDYRSDEDLEAYNASMLEGGVHEAYGPRPNRGGRVFRDGDQGGHPPV